MSSLMLIDGNSLTYRAFFALPTDMATASGQVTNAAFGFTSMLINLVRDHPTEYIAVTFDRPEPTFRHRRLASYKANRESAPDILRQQMGLVREIVETLSIPILELPGFEADDIIATLATRAAAEGTRTIVVTGDRDSYQLVADPHIAVLYNKRGVSDYAMYDEAGIRERTGVSPRDYVIYAALRGDPSDNLPGVPGVGEKTAAKLVNQYGSLDELFAHLDELTPKLRTNLAENELAARTNVELMTLVRDAPVDVEVRELSQGAIEADELSRLFGFLEFNSLMARMPAAFGSKLDISVPERRVLTAEVVRPPDGSASASWSVVADALPTLVDGRQVSVMAGTWLDEPGRSELRGIAVTVRGGEVAWFDRDWIAANADLLSEHLDRMPLVAHDAKPLVRSLLDCGVDRVEVAADTKLAAYLLDPADSRYDITELLVRYCDIELAVADVEPDDGELDLFRAERVGRDESAAMEVAAAHAVAVAAMVGPVHDAVTAQNLDRLYRDVELPLVEVLAAMESLGIAVDVAELTRLRDRLRSRVAELEAAIHADAGRPFNVNSTKQLREVLFDELGLTPQKKTKTGFSTDAASLEKLRGEHAIVDHLLAYREVEKLRGTYGEGLLAEVASDGRIHATFNQTVARTGRLSSDQPNLHNIPVRSEEGRRFRRAFIPSAGKVLLVADYNQIELRCIAHLAADPGLIHAFESGADIHTSTAARVFGVDADDVTTAMRSTAKMVSYGLAYGMEAYGLSQRLSVPVAEAERILTSYFDAFPSVADYMRETVREARERGYTETLFGRRRQIPELQSPNARLRQAGERQAMNAGIQGLAADIFKVALIAVHRRLGEQRLDAAIVLQVHDEIVVEAALEQQHEATEVVLDSMRHAFEMRVPLEVNMAAGATWADAKS